MSPGATFPAAMRRAATPYRLMLAHLARGAYASPVQAEGGTPGLLAQGRPEAKAEAGTASLLTQGSPAAKAEGGKPRSPMTPAWAGAGAPPAFPYTVTPAGAHPSVRWLSLSRVHSCIRRGQSIGMRSADVFQQAVSTFVLLMQTYEQAAAWTCCRWPTSRCQAFYFHPNT